MDEEMKPEFGKLKDFNPEAELDPFSVNAKSSVKLVYNTKGVYWEIKVVSGEEGLMQGLMEEAVRTHRDIKTELNNTKEDK